MGFGRRRVAVVIGRRTPRRKRRSKNFEERIAGAEAVVATDEGRFGMKVWFHRRWCPRGVRPPWIVDERYEWLWVYVAVEPETGKSVFLFLPSMESVCFQRFLEEVSESCEGKRLAVVLDNAPFHRRRRVRWPESLSPISLPPYSPELNPVEQVFRHLRKRLANRIFETLSQLSEALTQALHEFWDNPSVLIRLTDYPWWKQGVSHIPSLS
jgi:transposase